VLSAVFLPAATHPSHCDANAFGGQTHCFRCASNGRNNLNDFPWSYAIAALRPGVDVNHNVGIGGSDFICQSLKSTILEVVGVPRPDQQHIHARMLPNGLNRDSHCHWTGATMYFFPATPQPRSEALSPGNPDGTAIGLM
jgi:hypothetical protein